jgi:hypothetical protein
MARAAYCRALPLQTMRARAIERRGREVTKLPADFSPLFSLNRQGTCVPGRFAAKRPFYFAHRALTALS